MNMRTLIILLFSITSMNVNGQDLDQDHNEHDHEHNHKHDHFHKNEIGISLSPTVYLKESVVSLGAHAHYIHRLGETRFGAGIGFEAVFDEHKHRTLSTVFQWSPTYNTHICVAPGVVIAEHDHLEEMERRILKP